MIRILRGLGLAAMTTLALLACASEDRKTQVTVAITSETEIPKELDTLEVVVIDADGSESSRVLHDVQNPRFFPATLAVVPRSSRSLEGSLTVGKDAQVFRRAVVSYVEGRTLLLPMPLRMACFNFRGCGVNETCSGGTCQPARVEPNALADYDDRLVFGRSAPETCFDEATCIAGSQKVPVRPEDCTFALPEGSSREGERPRVNVSIRWKAAPSRVIVLDVDDPIEGWTRVADGRGKLSAGVCASLLDQEPDPKKRLIYDQALDVWLSTRCAAKTGSQPYCTSSDGHVGIGATLTPP
jgi:hypothetical protein